MFVLILGLKIGNILQDIHTCHNNVEESPGQAMSELYLLRVTSKKIAFSLATFLEILNSTMMTLSHALSPTFYITYRS